MKTKYRERQRKTKTMRAQRKREREGGKQVEKKDRRKQKEIKGQKLFQNYNSNIISILLNLRHGKKQKSHISIRKTFSRKMPLNGDYEVNMD